MTPDSKAKIRRKTRPLAGRRDRPSRKKRSSRAPQTPVQELHLDLSGLDQALESGAVTSPAPPEPEIVSKLAQGIAQEVRNPLFAIQVNLGALVRTLGENDEIKAFVLNLLDESRRLDQLMRDLLTLGHPLDRASFADCRLGDILLQAAIYVEEASPGSRARIDLDVPPDGHLLLGVPEKLVLAFVHLLNNALLNSPSTGRIVVKSRAGGSSLVVEIRDAGTGIPEEVRDSLFEPFVSTHAGHKGLGLALARHYLLAHGGSIAAANNQPPPGATFTVTLPAGRGAHRV